REIVNDNNGKIIEHLNGKIDIKNEKIHLTIEPGEIITVVGTSSISQFISTFYEKHEILIDGVNIKELNRNWLLENLIGIIPHETEIFSTSIKENILYGCNRNISDEELIKI